jgi:hypothetical protein
MMMIMMMCGTVSEMTGSETKVCGENLLQCHFVHCKSYMTRLVSNLTQNGGKPATNHLSYDTARQMLMRHKCKFWQDQLPMKITTKACLFT